MKHFENFTAKCKQILKNSQTQFNISRTFHFMINLTETKYRREY